MLPTFSYHKSKITSRYEFFLHDAIVEIELSINRATLQAINTRQKFITIGKQRYFSRISAQNNSQIEILLTQIKITTFLKAFYTLIFQ